MKRNAYFFERVLAYVLNSIILMMIIWAIGLPMTYLSAILQNPIIAFITVFVTYGIYLGYYPFFYGTSGQTIGKKIVGIRVVAANGYHLTIVTGILRFIGYIIASIPFGIGFIWMLFDDEQQNWPDKIAGTYVIKD